MIQEITSPLLVLEGICKAYYQGGEEITVLHNVALTLNPGEVVALLGPSGSGKSTLLQIAGLLDTPDSGHLTINGKAASHMSDAERTNLRLQALGFVYQFHNLLPEFSALENVMLPQMIAGYSRGAAAIRSRSILDSLGLISRISHRPGQLSGGEQQRCAVARALANNPIILLADEPTGNLDTATASSVFLTLMEIVRKKELSAVIATHNHSLARRMDRILELRDGALLEI